MSAREMWAPQRWQEIHGTVSFTGNTEPLWSGDVRVLVQEIPEGMPEFKPEDRVQTATGRRAIAIGAPIPHDDGWVVPVNEGGRFVCWWSNGLTLIPPETSRLIRVTGPEEDVDALMDVMTGPEAFRNAVSRGVRVEVVDEDA